MFSSLFQRAVTNRVLPTCRRYLSSQMPLIASPTYYVYGADTMLAFKVIPPTFKVLRNNSVVLDSNRKGRILLEWSPRAATFGECFFFAVFLGNIHGMPFSHNFPVFCSYT